MKTIRWGLLSTARINRRLIPAIRASKNGKLVAAASRDLSKVQAYAAEWEIPTTFGSYDQMLSSDTVDAVYIGLPNHLHAEWTVRALEAGKHVLCEKPFALSVSEVDQMIAASRKTGGVLQEGFMYRHHPQTKLVQEWVRGGRLGDIRVVRGAYSFYMQNRAGNVRLVPEYGGGALWDVGIYPLSYAQLIFDSLPESVLGQQSVGENGVDESFFGQMNYENGQAAQIAGSFQIPYWGSVDIVGTQGMINLNRPFGNMNEKGREIVFTSLEGKEERPQVILIDPYQAEVEDMNAAIIEGKPPLISLDESRRHIQVACALYESAKNKSLVPLDSGR